ncbi:flagellar basal body protein [Chrysiogenes arsenatis]|uniref:flagellar basal body protein n=1 Tax=Chrysiogenes arsenatis TaxID=309797 RepID=UPI0004078B86|nr:flagellar basal body protein [Chrysiogenes arsenatis]
MIDAFFNTASALRNIGVQHSATANNLANVNTDGYKSQRVNATEGPRGGTQLTGVERDTSPGSLRPTGIPEDKVSFSSEAMNLTGYRETSNVDLAKELVQNNIFGYAMKTNTSVMTTQNAMVGTLLDVVS